MIKGERLIDSAPPATAKSASPNIRDCVAETMACAPDPQRRLTFMAGAASGIPASIAATRDRYISRGSVLMTWPKTTWPTCPGSTPDRSIAAFVTWVPNWLGGVPARLPPKVPMAVRAPSRITISDMDHSFLLRFGESLSAGVKRRQLKRPVRRANRTKKVPVSYENQDQSTGLSNCRPVSVSSQTEAFSITAGYSGRPHPAPPSRLTRLA